MNSVSLRPKGLSQPRRFVTVCAPGSRRLYLHQGMLPLSWRALLQVSYKASFLLLDMQIPDTSNTLMPTGEDQCQVSLLAIYIKR